MTGRFYKAGRTAKAASSLVVKAAKALALGAAALFLLAATAAGEDSGGNGTTCGECHLRNDHTKDFSTPHPELLEGGRCAAYAGGSCCTGETVAKIFPPLEGNEVPYGAEYRPDRCGPLSSECAAWFTAEECLYECDVHAGRFRVNKDCLNAEGKEEAWRMFGMPIKASECQAWFEACRDDLFCSCHGDAPCRESWMTPGSIFSFPELDCTEESGECIKFSEIYDGPKDFCEQIYDFAFKYEEDEEAAYSFVGGPEVNEAVDHNVAFPENTCNPNATASDDLCDA